MFKKFQDFTSRATDRVRNWGPNWGRGPRPGRQQPIQAPQPAPAPAPPATQPSKTPQRNDSGSSPPAQTAPIQKDQGSDGTLPIALVNKTNSNEVYVYITGLALKNNNAWFLLKSDGTTPYYPANPSGVGQPLQADCAIRLAGPGQSRTVNIPQIAGGRIFVSIGKTLTFLLNPGPALVEPSVLNQSDPNINTNWSFAEFTYNGPVYANISYVDFVGIPIALQLKNKSGATQTVPGMPANGLDTVCNRLRDQSNKDGVAGWKNLIVQNNGQNLRALSPNSSLGSKPNDFNNYFEGYVNDVWNRYQNNTLSIKTADNALNTSGKVTAQNGQLTVDNTGFTKPSTADIFSCNTGPFVTGSDNKRNVIIPQLCAAFNRTTLLTSATTPSSSNDFYKNPVTNHYARILHEVATDGRGYAFAYDDVNSAEGKDQSGFVNDPNPDTLTVTFGGL